LVVRIEPHTIKVFALTIMRIKAKAHDEEGGYSRADRRTAQGKKKNTTTFPICL